MTFVLRPCGTLRDENVIPEKSGAVCHIFGRGELQ